MREVERVEGGEGSSEEQMEQPTNERDFHFQTGDTALHVRRMTAKRGCRDTNIFH